ncbi:cytoskeleton-associated protein 2-like [Sigmodon hispidus]
MFKALAMPGLQFQQEPAAAQSCIIYYRTVKKTQELKPQKQQEAHQGNSECTNPVVRTHVKKQSSKGFPDEMNKENVPQTLLKSGKPDPDSCPISQPNTGSCKQAQRSLAPKQILSRSSVNRTVLNDRANKRIVRNTQVRVQPMKSQHLSADADPAQPRENLPRTVPSRFILPHNKTQTSKKPVVKDIKVTRVKSGRANETNVQSHPATEQKVKHTKPGSHPSLLQGEQNKRHPTIKHDQKTVQPCLGPRTSCILQKPRAVSQRPNLTTGNCNSAILSNPSIRVNKTPHNKFSSTFQQKAQTLDFKFKKVLPQSQFLSKTAPKTQVGTATTSRKRPLNATQTHSCVKRTEVEDRRKQLEEWQKSKGKTYKRPPMKLKTKRKVIEEMNISFWKSIEREEEEKKAQLELSNKINATLTECLRLIEEGVFPIEIFTIVSSIPEVEKFSKFWLCKAKFLASKGTFDAIELYEEAIKSGAAPTQELREILNILQDPGRRTEGVTSDSLAAGTKVTSLEELAKKEESEQQTEGDQVTAKPPITVAEWDNPGIKLQIAPVPRICGLGVPEVLDMKLITPQ